MYRLPFFILLLGIFLCAKNALAIHPTLSYQTFPKFTMQEVTSAIQKQLMESIENLSIEQLYTIGEEGLGDSGTATMESSVEGVTMTMPVASFVNEKKGLTKEVLKDAQKSVDVIKENIQMPTAEQAKKITTAELKEKEKAITELQTNVTRDALSVALANVQISAEQDKRQKELEETIAKSTTLRGDIQARSKATLSVLGEVNRLLGVDSKYLGVEAAAALGVVQSNVSTGKSDTSQSTEKQTGSVS